MEELPLLSTEGAMLVDFLSEFNTTHYPNIDQDTKSKILKLHDPANNFRALGMEKVEELIDKNPTMLLWTIDPDESLKIPLEILRIFTGNCIKVCGDPALYQNVHEVALYNNISLINHSCIPNSIWSWVKGDFKRRQVKALKAIEKGQEILVNYSEQGPEINYGSKSRGFRREELLEKRGFLCLCSECSLEGKALEDNEKMREKIGGMRAKVAQLVGKFHWGRALEESLETLDLLKKLDIRLQFLKEFLGAYMVASGLRKYLLLGPDPEIFLDAALDYAIGDVYMDHYNEKAEEFDMLIHN